MPKNLKYLNEENEEYYPVPEVVSDSYLDRLLLELKSADLTSDAELAEIGVKSGPKFSVNQTRPFLTCDHLKKARFLTSKISESDVH